MYAQPKISLWKGQNYYKDVKCLAPSHLLLNLSDVSGISVCSEEAAEFLQLAGRESKTG